MSPEEARDLFAPFGPVTVRRMFGGLGIYADGRIIGIVADGEVFLKADARTAPRFAEAGSAPFVTDGKGRPVTMPYWRLPAEAWDDPEQLTQWASLAREAAETAPPPRARRRARAPRRSP